MLITLWGNGCLYLYSPLFEIKCIEKSWPRLATLTSIVTLNLIKIKKNLTNLKRGTFKIWCIILKDYWW